jgi:hypothetical protein
MASAHRHLVLAAYRRKVSRDSSQGLADPAKEAARRQSMRMHPSNHAARGLRPLRREEKS